MNNSSPEELMTQLRVVSHTLGLRLLDLINETQRAGRTRFAVADLLNIPTSELKDFFERQETALDRRQTAIVEAISVTQRGIDSCRRARKGSN